jgi:hypothetical protein
LKNPAMVLSRRVTVARARPRASSSRAKDSMSAAALHGVAQAFQDRMGSPWQESAARDRRDSLDQARAHLGDEQLERAYARGMALSLDQAFDLALRRPDPG